MLRNFYEIMLLRKLCELYELRELSELWKQVFKNSFQTTQFSGFWNYLIKLVKCKLN